MKAMGVTNVGGAISWMDLDAGRPYVGETTEEDAEGLLPYDFRVRRESPRRCRKDAMGRSPGGATFAGVGSNGLSNGLVEDST